MISKEWLYNGSKYISWKCGVREHEGHPENYKYAWAGSLIRK